MPTLTPIDKNHFDEFYDATGADKPAPVGKAQLLGNILFGALPGPAKLASLPLNENFRKGFMEGMEKSGRVGVQSMMEALENQYKPDNAVAVNDAGEWLDQSGKVIPSQRRPNLLPITKSQPGQGWFGSNFEGAMPAMADIWNTMGGVGGKATLGAGPMLRPALKYQDKIYKAKEGQQHLDALPAHLQDTFQKMAMSGEDISHFDFGFINHKGHFLTREKALEYAIKEGILDPNDAKYGTLVTTMLNDSGGGQKLASQAAAQIREMKAPTFYSAAEKAVEGIKQNKASGEQWLSTIGNQKGVKGEELEWIGLKDFLAGKQSVTKQEIQDYLKNNKVELQEVWKGNDKPLTIDQVKQLAAEGKPFHAVEKANPERIASVTLDNGQLLPWAEKNADKFIFRQGTFEDAVKLKGNSTKYHSYQLPGGPLSRDTEILTNKSWKRIDEIEIGDVIMTRKDEGGILEWQPVLAVPKVYAENLYHFFSQSVDMRVTENHQMVVKKRRRNKKGIIRTTARELWKMHEMVIPLTGVWTGKGSEKILNYNANDIAEFIGWYLSEGSYKQKNGAKNTIQIAQCRNFNPEKCDRLEALFNRLGFKWKYYGDAYGVSIKSMNKDLINLLHSQPKSDNKYIPEFFFNEGKSVIQSLLDGLILGDGNISKQVGRLDKITYFTNSKRLAGDVQALILMIGKRASVRQRPSGLYCVGINQKEWCSVDDSKHEIAPYNDFAFCVTVENHSIYVRRNGVAAFTGNTNYRELLLTLPSQRYQLKQLGSGRYTIRDTETNKFIRDASGAGRSFENANLAKQEIEHLNKINDNSKEYKSSHWDEPNILAHMRMNDRTIDGKKSLHLEEIQSDWHQQGRDKGYSSSKSKAEFDRLNKEFEDARSDLGFATEKKANELLGMSYQKYRAMYPAEKDEALKKLKEYRAQDPEYVALEKKVEDLEKARNAVNPSGGVPDAPFKKTWHELALKRAIREAAENGYERLSWTPGEAQAARYDLSKQVKEIAVPMVNKDGTRSVRIDPLNGGTSFKLMVDQKSIVDGSHSASQFSGKPLSDVVGKEMADKIMKLETPDTFSGEGLKIGGEGMKGFYDQIIPKSISKLMKEYNLKIEKSKTEKGDEIFYIDLPSKTRDNIVNKGFPLFSGTPVLVPIDFDPFKEERK